MKCVLDTDIFDRLIDRDLDLDHFPADAEFVATHIQIEELKNVPKAKRGRKRQLLLKFAELAPEIVPPESMVWGAMVWGQMKWGDGAIYNALKADLDSYKAKENNSKDALIAEVAIANRFTLITTDRNLAKVAKKHGGLVIDIPPDRWKSAGRE